MLNSFGNKETRNIWKGDKIKRLPVDIQEIARRKLRMLNNSQNLKDLQTPPSNRLEKLKGDLKEYYSIRINNNRRIIFQWKISNAELVEITDYH